MNRRIDRVKNWLTEFHLDLSGSPGRTDGQVPRWLAAFLIIWCMFDFAAFVVGATFLGGDALNGHSGGGHYFVCMHDHCREVTEAVFEYSRWHAISLFLSFPVAFLLSWLANQPKSRARRN